MIVSNLLKSGGISILSLIVYVVITDRLDENKVDPFNKGYRLEQDKTKEYCIIFGIISISSFLVINMTAKNTELVPLQMSTIKEPLLNNKPPF